jgi:hypothetical protein
MRDEGGENIMPKKIAVKKKTTKKPAVKAKKAAASKPKKKVAPKPKTAGGGMPSASLFPYTFSKHSDLVWHTQRFKKFLNRLEDEDRADIEKAYAFADKRHASLRRDDGTPYIIHPVRVANILIDEWKLTETAVIIASLLHDVVEDTQTTLKEVKDAFGGDVGTLVDGITMWKGSETPDVYLKRVSRGPEPLRIIKCADTLDNLRSWHACGSEAAAKFPRWWRQAKDYVIPMAHRTLPKAEGQLYAIVENEWYLRKAGMI